MEIYILIFVLLFIIFTVINFHSKIKNRKRLKEFKGYLKTLEKFELQLDTIKINEFHWQESVPVDIYDNELDPNNPFFIEHQNIILLDLKIDFISKKV